MTYWRDAKGVNSFTFAGAVARERWEVSAHAPHTEITEAAFDAMIASVAFDRL